jgi:hypothetical protein
LRLSLYFVKLPTPNNKVGLKMSARIGDSMSLERGQVIQFLTNREKNGSQLSQPLISEMFTVLQAWAGTEKEELMDCDRLYNLRSQTGDNFIYKVSRQAKDTIQLNCYKKTTPYGFSKPYEVRIVGEVHLSQRRPYESF